MTLPYPPPYQDLATLSAHICASESAIENWVRLGLFPPPRKVGGQAALVMERSRTPSCCKSTHCVITRRTSGAHQKWYETGHFAQRRSLTNASLPSSAPSWQALNFRAIRQRRE